MQPWVAEDVRLSKHRHLLRAIIGKTEAFSWLAFGRRLSVVYASFILNILRVLSWRVISTTEYVLVQLAGRGLRATRQVKCMHTAIFLLVRTKRVWVFMIQIGAGSPITDDC